MSGGVLSNPKHETISLFQFVERVITANWNWDQRLKWREKNRGEVWLRETKAKDKLACEHALAVFRRILR